MSERKVYPSDATDAEWSLLERLLPPAKTTGRPRKHDLREMVNAIFYLVRSGCPWRYLPDGFPPWQTVYSLFREWRRNGIWEQINQRLTQEARTQARRAAQASAGIIGIQSVKTTRKGGSRLLEGGKKINGRKRHIVVDTVGHLLKVMVHPANVQDRDGAWEVFEAMTGHFPHLKRVWADQGIHGSP